MNCNTLKNNINRNSEIVSYKVKYFYVTSHFGHHKEILLVVETDLLHIHMLISLDLIGVGRD